MILELLRHVSFEYPWVLLLLLGLPFLFFYSKKSSFRIGASFKVSSISAVRSKKKLIYPSLILWLRILGLAALIIAMSNPRQKFVEQKTSGEGIDIMLCMDISGSMTEQDFTPNRIEAAKQVAAQFVSERVGDRIGLTIFSSVSYTLCPLTSDHQAVLRQLANAQPGYLQDDGTAIGAGLATSVNRLRQSEAKSKVCILLTDGVDYGGQISPDVATKMAEMYHVKVYTIGIGSNKEMEETVDGNNGPTTEKRKMDFNENLLKTIAKKTGGAYFQATNNNALAEVYNRINQLEKSKIEISTFNRYNSLYLPWLLLGMAFLVLEIIVKYLIYKKFP